VSQGTHEILSELLDLPATEVWHFAELLDELLGWIDTGHRPAALATRTLAKYTLLAEAAAATARDEAVAG